MNHLVITLFWVIFGILIGHIFNAIGYLNARDSEIKTYHTLKNKYVKALFYIAFLAIWTITSLYPILVIPENTRTGIMVTIFTSNELGTPVSWYNIFLIAGGFFITYLILIMCYTAYRAGWRDYLHGTEHLNGGADK